MSDPLRSRIGRALDRPVHGSVAAFAKRLAQQRGATAVLFYGSNLRTGELDGVIDFYVLLPGHQRERIWPRVSYHEWEHEGAPLRAKVAEMALDTFARAAGGRSADTTIWARFVQPSALVWTQSEEAREAVIGALAAAARIAAQLAVALGPPQGQEREFWQALFQATYRAEFRVEKPGRENTILEANRAHFEGLLPLSLDSADIAFARNGDAIIPAMPDRQRRRIRRHWAHVRRLGKPLNLLRLVKASTTFEGAARYAAWKVERHTGVAVKVTPWRERHPLMAAPGVLWSVWRRRERG